jgi:UDP-N-acetylglucosamine 2-epimerase (non-hydrolysing)
VEATQESLQDPETSRKLLDELGLHAGEFIVATIHRPENTDDPERLCEILDALASAPIPVVFPVHPRTSGSVRAFGLNDRLARLRCISPIDHTTFLSLANQARLLISDSGGIQEECTIIKKPLIVVRNNTERPESIAAGFAVRVRSRREISEEIARILDNTELTSILASRPCPYGDGKASRRITDIALAMTAGMIPPHAEVNDEFTCSPGFETSLMGPTERMSQRSLVQRGSLT